MQALQECVRSNRKPNGKCPDSALLSNSGFSSPYIRFTTQMDSMDGQEGKAVWSSLVIHASRLEAECSPEPYHNQTLRIPGSAFHAFGCGLGDSECLQHFL